MSYYLSESPIQYRSEEAWNLPPTLQGPRHRRRCASRRRFRRGRPPLNQPKYPTVGVPVALGQFPFSVQVLKPVGPPPPPAPGIFDSLLALWNQRPESLKRIRFRLNPSQIMQTVQTVVPGKTVAQATDALRRYGISPMMLTPAGEVPISPGMAQFGYEAAGVDWKSYLPWILGGGAVLLLVLMPSGKRG